MNEQLLEKCDLLVQNKAVLNKVFAWDASLMNLSAALLLTEKNVLADKAKLKECENILKKSTGVFSDFRGNVRIPLICKMLLSNDPQVYFDNVSEAFKLISRKSVFGHEQMIMAAMSICDHAAPADYEKYANLTREIYDRMKKNHPFLTSEEDITFAAILALSDKDVDKLIDDMEASYAILKKKFSDNNAVQSLTHVLALGEQSPEEKCDKVLEVFAAMKSCKHKFGTGYELASLGAVAINDKPIDELVEMYAEVDSYLKSKRGFGDLALGSACRRLYAVQLCMDYVNPDANKGMDGVVLGSMLALTIAIEVCMIICMTTCVTAANSN